MSWENVLGGVLIAIITAGASILVARINRKRRPYEEAPYDSLANRVVALEKADAAKGKDLAAHRKRIEALEQDLDVAVGALRTWDDWIDSGSPPPAPTLSAQALAILKRHREQRSPA